MTNHTILRDQVAAFRRAFASNSTATAFTDKAPTLTEPSGDGVFKNIGQPSLGPKSLLVIPFGTAAANLTCKLRVHGWQKAGNLWLPTLLVETGACTFGARTGPSGGDLVTSSDYLADTVAITAANFPDAKVLSGASDAVGGFVLPLYGFDWIDFDGTRNASSASFNALWKVF